MVHAKHTEMLPWTSMVSVRAEGQDRGWQICTHWCNHRARHAGPHGHRTFVSASLQQWELFIAGGTALHQDSRAMLSPTRMAGLKTDSPRQVLEQTSTTSKHFQSRDLNLKNMEIQLMG